MDARSSEMQASISALESLDNISSSCEDSRQSVDPWMESWSDNSLEASDLSDEVKGSLEDDFES